MTSKQRAYLKACNDNGPGASAWKGQLTPENTAVCGRGSGRQRADQDQRLAELSG